MNEEQKKEITKREIEVLKLLYFENKDIAKMLFIAETTVKTYKANLREKLGGNSDRQLVIQALKQGVIKLEEVKTKRD